VADHGRGGQALYPGHRHLAVASNDQGVSPDVVMACCGDVPTLETLAAVSIMREHLPGLKIRVVNVVDLMKLQPQSEHSHGLSDIDFDDLFTLFAPIYQYRLWGGGRLPALLNAPLLLSRATAGVVSIPVQGRHETKRVIETIMAGLSDHGQETLKL
jgi:hypothetical protein